MCSAYNNPSLSSHCQKGAGSHFIHPDFYSHFLFCPLGLGLCLCPPPPFSLPSGIRCMRTLCVIFLSIIPRFQFWKRAIDKGPASPLRPSVTPCFKPHWCLLACRHTFSHTAFIEPLLPASHTRPTGCHLASMIPILCSVSYPILFSGMFFLAKTLLFSSSGVQMQSLVCMISVLRHWPAPPAFAVPSYTKPPLFHHWRNASGPLSPLLGF